MKETTGKEGWRVRWTFGWLKILVCALVVAIGNAVMADSLVVIGEHTWSYMEINNTVTVTGVFPTPATGAVSIPSRINGFRVTSIGSSAFSRCSGLTSVEIPSGVTSIGSYAFYGCSGLTSVSIPSSVTRIEESVFRDCSGLTLVSIPSGMTGIGDYVFFGCSGLTSVSIPSSVTRIGVWAFSGCSGLTSIVVDSANPNYKSVNGMLLSKDGRTLLSGVNGDVRIPSGVTSIGGSAFWGRSGLTSVSIPSSVTEIGSSAFRGCGGLTSVEIPSSVTSIGYGAFENCSGLMSVAIPSSVTRIGDSAFSGCSGLTSVEIPSSVTNIGGYAFRGCSGLMSIVVDFANSNYKSANGMLLSKDGRELLVGVNGDVRIPSGVTSIRRDAFGYLCGLTSVTIPSSVTNIGWYAFSGCSGLTSIVVDSANSNYKSANGMLLSKDGRKLLVGVNGDVRIPSGVTSIGSDAFEYLRGLTSVTISSSVTSIGFFAFGGCSGLSKVVFMGDAPSMDGNAVFPTNAVAYVRRGSTGWGVPIPGTWCGVQIRYMDDCQFSFGDVSVVGWSGKYDGAAHGVSVTVADGIADALVKYASASGGPYSSTRPTLTDAGTLTTWCEISAPGYIPLTNSATVSISKRVVTLASASAAKVYDGTPLVDGTVAVGGDGFADGEGVTFTVTGSQTDVGESVNVFTYALNENTKSCNYEITSEFGALAVTKATFGGGSGSGGAGGGSGDEGEPGSGAVEPGDGAVAEGCLSKFDVAVTYDGLGHAIDTNALTAVFRAATGGEVSVSYANAVDTSGMPVWRSDVPAYTNVGRWAMLYRVSSQNYADFVHAVRVTVRPRHIVLTSGSACKTYDGSVLVNGVVTVGGDGFADGEGATFTVTGSQTAMGESANAFTYRLNENTKASNYFITTVFGRLVVAEPEALKFSKSSVTVKESAVYAELTVNRTAKNGRVRARYATADGTAKAGEDYKATTGVLEWPDGDRKAKKIRIPLIPDLVAAYDGVPSKTFTVRLSAVSADELYDFERLPTFAAGDTCTVTVTETSKEGVTVASVYAKQAAKRATVKKDEDVPLSSGTFFGVVEEDGNRLTNGLPKLASITFTASTAAPPALSAKVAVGGKTCTFSAKGWDDMSAGGGVPAVRTRTLVNVQKVGKVAHTNTLTVAVRDGATTDENAWLEADATVELVMNVPDVKGKGFQTGVRYAGALYRQNAKIQAYLDAARTFAGYYTVALVADGGAGRPALPDGGTDSQSAGRPALPDGGTDSQSVGRDVPVAPNGGRDDDDGSIGNGYLTLTIDNKGNAKVAGILADGATKPSTSPKACAIMADETSVNGYTMLVPVHFAKGTVCFGGTLRLYAVEDASNPDGSGIRIVADAASPLAWYDDSAVGCVAIHGDGKKIPLAPCGGWYDKVVNLQRHYLDYALSVETADVTAFPADELPDGYRFVEGVSPDGFALALENDKVVHDRKKIVKTNRLTDFALSTNVCNVSVKLARATGLVTGGFSLWGESVDGAKQKELTGFKVYGVLLLARDPSAPLDDHVVAPGFVTKKVKTTYYDDNGRKKTLTWPFSAPFNIVGE